MASWILCKLIEDTLLYMHLSHSFLNNPYKVDLGDTVHEGVDCIQLAQSRVLRGFLFNVLMNVQVP